MVILIVIFFVSLVSWDVASAISLDRWTSEKMAAVWQETRSLIFSNMLLLCRILTAPSICFRYSLVFTGGLNSKRGILHACSVQNFLWPQKVEHVVYMWPGYDNLVSGSISSRKWKPVDKTLYFWLRNRTKCCVLSANDTNPCVGFSHPESSWIRWHHIAAAVSGTMRISTDPANPGNVLTVLCTWNENSWNHPMGVITRPLCFFHS